jgi:hypothetical protein
LCKFFLALFEEKKLNHNTSNTLDGYPAGYPVSGLTGYPAGYPADQFAIRPDTGYQKKPDYPAGYPVQP